MSLCVTVNFNSLSPRLCYGNTFCAQGNILVCPSVPGPLRSIVFKAVPPQCLRDLFRNCIVDGLKVSPFSSSPHVEQRFQPLSFVSQQFLAGRGGENLSGVTPTSAAACFMMRLRKQSQFISSTGQKRRKKTTWEGLVTFSVFPLSYRHLNSKASNARPERKTGVLRWNAAVVYPQTLQSGRSLCS